MSERIYRRYLTTTYAARNDLSEAGLRGAIDHYERHFVRHLPADRSAEVLEIGCGSGAFLLMLRKLGFADLTGVDISPEQADFCRAQKLDVHCSDGLDYLRAANRRFDLIVLNDVLEHLDKEHVLDMLDAVRNRLQAKGRVIVRVPNMSNPLNLRTRYVDFTHQTGFTKESLAQVLRTTGFEVGTIDGEYILHRRLLARCVFDRLLWRAFLALYRHTMHLTQEVVRGKNLIGVADVP